MSAPDTTNVPAPDDRPLVDKYGHRYRLSVLRSWSVTCQRVMGLRWTSSGKSVVDG